MAAKKPKRKMPVKKQTVSKLNVWLKHYLNETNPTTFLNKTASAKAAKYQCNSEDSFSSMGNQCFRKLQPKIAEWLDKNAFSEAALGLKHQELLQAQKSVFYKVKGKVNGEDLPEGVQIIAESDRMSIAGQGEQSMPYDDGETLLAINVGDPEIQRKSLDMAYKVKGTYAAEKREHGGAVGLVPMTDFPPEPASIEEWEKNRKLSEKKLHITES